MKVQLATIALAALFSAAIAGRKVKCEGGGRADDARCCVWYKVLEDVQSDLFDNGKCDEVAHDALRLTFHDAIGWSKSLKKKGQWNGGGADGSIMKFKDTEFTYLGNVGLDEFVEMAKPVADKYGVSYGDFIQFAGAVSVRNCPGGPKIQFKAGRPDAQQPAPSEGLLPSPGDSVDTILARMDDAGFTAKELVALLASHSVGVQSDMDLTVADSPFDTTPTELDSQFYLETLLHGTQWAGDANVFGTSKTAIKGAYRLQSDDAIARDPRTSCEWQNFIVNESDMQTKFGDAMYKLSLVGQDEQSLYDCSDVIPDAIARKNALPKLPAGLSIKDIDFSCSGNSKLLQNIVLPTIKLPVSIPKFTLGTHRLNKAKNRH